MQEANKESQIHIGLLEFKPTEENYAKIGKMVWQVLNRSEQRRKQTISLMVKRQNFIVKR